jgi:hypothetical protein
MTCAKHPETEATAFCRNCGKALCPACQRTAQGTIFCEEHYAAAAPGVSGVNTPYSPYTSPYTATTDPSASPGLAFLLGLIPGVGAIYNGQYAKGLIHVIILGLLISIMNTGAAGGLEPLFGLLTALWFFYMAFEAYHTALKRQRGEPVDEFSSIVPLRQQPGGLPIGPIVLIGLGVVFLLNTMEIIRLYQILKYWPVFLIVLGAYLLYARMAPGNAASVEPSPEVGHER